MCENAGPATLGFSAAVTWRPRLRTCTTGLKSPLVSRDTLPDSRPKYIKCRGFVPALEHAKCPPDFGRVGPTDSEPSGVRVLCGNH